MSLLSKAVSFLLILLFIIVGVQSLSVEKYGDFVGIVWLGLIIATLPLYLVINWDNRLKLASETKTVLFKVFSVFVICYLMLILFTVLLEPFFSGKPSITTQSFYLRSISFLIPFELFLLLFFRLFRKHKQVFEYLDTLELRPSLDSIIAPEDKEEYKAKISNGNVTQVLKALLAKTNESHKLRDHYKTIIILSRLWHVIQKDKGIFITDDQAEAKEAIILRKLLDMLN